MATIKLNQITDGAISKLKQGANNNSSAAATVKAAANEISSMDFSSKQSIQNELSKIQKNLNRSSSFATELAGSIQKAQEELVANDKATNREDNFLKLQIKRNSAVGRVTSLSAVALLSARSSISDLATLPRRQSHNIFNKITNPIFEFFWKGPLLSKAKIANLIVRSSKKDFTYTNVGKMSSNDLEELINKTRESNQDTVSRIKGIDNILKEYNSHADINWDNPSKEEMRKYKELIEQRNELLKQRDELSKQASREANQLTLAEWELKVKKSEKGVDLSRYPYKVNYCYGKNNSKGYYERFNKGNCTWYAMNRYNEMNPDAPLHMKKGGGNAGQWVDNCDISAYDLVKTNTANSGQIKENGIAINSYKKGGNHVAYIEKVYTDTESNQTYVYISEDGKSVPDGRIRKMRIEDFKKEFDYVMHAK